jgi:CO/xanthine dehydrogenase Mo-binding subunit
MTLRTTPLAGELRRWKLRRTGPGKQAWHQEPTDGQGTGCSRRTTTLTAQAVEVEVDIETGHVRIVQVVSADDVGKAINPNLVIGQIEGAIVQAQGYAILEDFQTSGGRVVRIVHLFPPLAGYPFKSESVY